MPTRYDKEFKQNIINLYKQGESAAQLAWEYGIGYSTVHKWIQGQAKTQSGKSPDEIKDQRWLQSTFNWATYPPLIQP